MKKMLLFLFFITFFCSFSTMLLGENEYSGQPYQRFVSLGNCCVSRTQINAHLKKRFEVDPYAFGGGQLFDWLVIHDMRKLAAAIENNLVDLLERSDLVLGPSWSKEYICVKNVKYNMTWNHLFTRRTNYSLDPNIINLEYTQKKAKIDYLAKKFRDLANYRTLYIFTYPEVGNEMQTKEPGIIAIRRLRNAIAKIRGNNNFDLLYCSLYKKFDDFENILNRVIVNPTNGLYVEGDYTCWHALLSQFPFELDPTVILHDDDDVKN